MGIEGHCCHMTILSLVGRAIEQIWNATDDTPSVSSDLF